MDTARLKEVLIGAQLTLIDEEAVEYFRFGRDNHVAVTLGTRSGAVCAPILIYRVTENGTVELGGGSPPSYIWEDVELHDGVLSVKCGAFLKRFKFLPGVERPAPYLP